MFSSMNSMPCRIRYRIQALVRRLTLLPTVFSGFDFEMRMSSDTATANRLRNAWIGSSGSEQARARDRSPALFCPRLSIMRCGSVTKMVFLCLIASQPVHRHGPGV
jgi:hypothetical protein